MTDTTIKAEPLMPLCVLADPERKGKHPLHDNRFVCTAGSYFEEEHYPGYWLLDKGQIVCKMMDCEQQARYARLFAVAPELLESCQELLTMVEEMLPKHGPCGWGTMATDMARERINRALGQ